MRQLRRVKDLGGLALKAKDGAIGSIEEILFDDSSWDLRYLVVNTGSWLLGRRVLIVPPAVAAIDDAASVIAVDLSRQQVEDSPPLDSKAPISRQFEEEYYKYYGWAPYWGGGIAAEPYPPPPRVMAKAVGDDEVPSEAIRRTHLRSSDEVTGYYIEAADGEIGHVEDIVIDDEAWSVAHFEVDTRNWWPGKKVLVPRTRIEAIDWLERKVRMNLTRDAIQSAPEYDASKVIGRDYELALFEYYSSGGGAVQR